uniref:Uncharacterized protein n=1 Tax=Branchiostoma floridae TaxID=7739 RepID=C3YM71_BRAFL|eukprot:XP_002602653.1 hypothetical protein BRAFLDRAFT_81933 [Branchiostoma floridae]
MPGNVDLGLVDPGISCGAFDRSQSTISIQGPAVVLATDDSLTGKLAPNTLEQCRQVWEYKGGIAITVGRDDRNIFRLISTKTDTGNTDFEGVAMSFAQTQDASTLITTESGCSQKHTNYTNNTHNDTENITCILLTKDEHTELFFTIAPVQCQTLTTPTTYRTDTYQSSIQAENGVTFLRPKDNSTLQVNNVIRSKSEVRTATDYVLNTAFVLVEVCLVVMAVALAWKLLLIRINAKDKTVSDDAHFWTIPSEVTSTGLVRSASLPTCSRKMASDDVASCRSLPAVLHSIEPTYSEIPDDLTAAHWPLPSLPHTYWEIPDNIAAAQRPLPCLPHTYWEIPDDAISRVERPSSLSAVPCTRRGDPDDAVSCRSLPAVTLSIKPTYSEIPDHLAAAQRPLPRLSRAHPGRPQIMTPPQRPLPALRHTYSEIPDDEESGPLTFYADVGFSHHVVTNTGQNVTFPILSDTQCPCGISEDRTRATPRRASLPLVTLPNTYWPWEISGEGTHNTLRRDSLLHVTLPNTPRRVSLPLVTPPNTYWPWEVPGEGTHDTTWHVSLPLVTPPNTYWPCGIPKERTCNTPQRVSLPPVTPPNTYWPWEVPDSNMLATVRQAWFTGLERLLTLVLSNNHIKQIEPGSFAHLTRLYVLDLENNLLQVVEPAWLFGLKGTMLMNLGLNEINSISPKSFQQIQLNWLDLTANDMSCLNVDVLQGQSALSVFHVGSGMLSSVHDAKPNGITWSLHRFADMMKGSATLVVEVRKFLFCTKVSSLLRELSFGWALASSKIEHRDFKVRRVKPGKSCGILDRSLSMIPIQAPVVVLATEGSLADELVPNIHDLCRQAWLYDGGITVHLVGSSVFGLASFYRGKTAFGGVAMSFGRTQDTDTSSTKEHSCSHKQTNHTDANHHNVTCILLTRYERMKLFFAVASTQCQTHTTPTTYRSDTDHSSSQTDYSEYTEQDHTSSEPGDNSTPQVSTKPEPEVPTATNNVLISVVVLTVVGLVVLSLLVLEWKLCSAGLCPKDERASDDAHFWTIPTGVTLPGLLRSASFPDISRKTTSDDIASCRSLPAVLTSIEPTYCEIPDDIAAAQRPLPGLPHAYWELPEACMVRSASLPVVRCIREDTRGGAALCRSLPTIPDHLAAAQRPLPVTTHTYSEIPDDEESGPVPYYADADAAHFSRHHVVTNRRQNLRACPDSNTTSSRQLSVRFLASYGSNEQTRAQRSNIYIKPPEVEPVRARRQLRAAFVSLPADQCFGTYVNVTDVSPHPVTLPSTYVPCEISGERTRVTSRRASLPTVTLPNTYMPCEISGDRTRVTSRRTSLPLITLPNTYMPCEISGEGIRVTSRRTSLPPVTLPDTYVACEISGEITRVTPQRTSFPLVTLPSTYVSCEISGEESRVTPRRTSLPTVTLPNTYMPYKRDSDDEHFWTIPPGVALPGLLRSASLPDFSRKTTSNDVASCRSLPAVLHSIETIYCEIPDGIAAAQRPLPGLPHTYWEIPDAGMVRSVSLPVVRCIREDNQGSAALCRSLPTIHDRLAAAQRPLPASSHTYSEIPDEEESGNVPYYADDAAFSRHHVVTNRRQNLLACPDGNTTSSRHLRFLASYGSNEQARAQQSNIYRKPLEVEPVRARRQLRAAFVSLPADQSFGTYVNVTDVSPHPVTLRRTSLPLATLPSTYVPCEISGTETRVTPRRASLPPVTLNDTYVQCETSGEGTRVTGRRASLPLLTVPNTYMPCEISGEGTRMAPTFTSTDTYWPWGIP